MVLSVGFGALVQFGPQWIGKLYSEEALISYTSPTILVEAIMLLAIFEKMKFSQRIEKCILFCSPAVFGVYLLHVHPIVFEHIINGIGKWTLRYSIPIMVVYILLLGLAILVVGLFIESIRLQLFKLLKLDVFVQRVYYRIEKHL